MKKFLLGISLLFAPIVAHAQWSVLPNGEYSYAFNYSTNASFVCGTATALGTGTCTLGAHAVTITSGTATATVSFNGTSGSTSATNVQASGVNIGSISITYGGAGMFFWPTPVSQGYAFRMDLAVTETGPINSMGIMSRGYSFVSPTNAIYNCCSGYDTFLQLAVGNKPPALGPVSIIMEKFSNPVLAVGGATTLPISASLELVPEPSTYAMMVLGLVSVGAMSRRKRKL